MSVLTVRGNRGADPARALARLDRYMEAALRAHAFPGATVACGRGCAPPFVRCYGHLDYARSAPVSRTTRYDLLCMTKPLTIGALLARAVAREGFDLEEPVAATLPPFGIGGKAAITWHHLLTHSGGLAPSHSYGRLEGVSRDDIVRLILEGEPRFAAGTRYEYSCDGFVVMGLALAHRAGLPLDVLVQQEVLQPLGLLSAEYGPAATPLQGDIAPTHPYRVARTHVMRGTTCEPLAAHLGGVSGNSGLFAHVEDVARFARAWLGHGPEEETAFFDPTVTARFQRPADPLRLGTAALSWDTRSPRGYTVAGRAFGPRSFGHTGASGCSLWLDPDRSMYVILLSNAVYEADGRRRYVRVRPRLTELAHDLLACSST